MKGASILQITVDRRGPVCLLALLLAILYSGCSAHRYASTGPGTTQRGLASWYGPKFHGRATASGEIFNMHGLTAAHRDLPLGSMIEVTHLDTGRQITVRVNDRGPFVRGRILDLSYGAAQKLGMVKAGVAQIELRVVSLGKGAPGRTYTAAYTVQAGAFREPANAVQLHGELKRDFPDAEIVVEPPWHRIRIGRFSRRSEAEALRKQLRHRGLKAVIIALPTKR